MTKTPLILEALMARVSTLNLLPVSFPEIDFTPPADGKYLDVAFFPNAPAWEGVSDGLAEQGLLQITVVWPKAQGLIAPYVAAGQVAAHFLKGSRYVSGSASVKIALEPRTAQHLSDDHETRVPVVISWTA